MYQRSEHRVSSHPLHDLMNRRVSTPRNYDLTNERTPRFHFANMCASTECESEWDYSGLRHNNSHFCTGNQLQESCSLNLSAKEPTRRELRRSSHRHPEAVDFAVVQATAVRFALRSEPATFSAEALLAEAAAACETDAMRGVVEA